MWRWLDLVQLPSTSRVIPLDEIVRSGMNPDWTRSLSDVTPTESRTYLYDLAGMELKRCDSLIRCLKPAEYWVWFHGCDSAAVCQEHRDTWIDEVSATFAKFGRVPCQDCMEVFSTFQSIMKSRAI